MTAWNPGDRVTITIDAPGTGLMPDPDYPVPGILVDLEEAFTVGARVYWRAKFVNRLGYITVVEP